MTLALAGCVAEVEPLAPDAPDDTPTHGREACAVEGESPPVKWPAPDLALEMWAGDMTDRCAREASGIRWALRGEADTERLCAEAGGTRGCFYTCRGKPVIVVSETASRGTPAHELAHWLYACSGIGAGNWNHGQEMFEDAIRGMRAASEPLAAEVVPPGPEPAPAGTCPGALACGAEGTCVDPAAYVFQSWPNEGNACGVFTLDGVAWEQRDDAGMCTIPCEGG